MRIGAYHALPMIDINSFAAEIGVFRKEHGACAGGLHGSALRTAHIRTLVRGAGLAVEYAASAEGTGDAARHRTGYGQFPAFFRA